MKFKYLYILLLPLLLLLSCQKSDKQIVGADLITEKDSVLIHNLLDSLSMNYKDNNDSLLDFSDFIVSNFPRYNAEINIKIAYIHFSKANYFLSEHYFKQAAQKYLIDSLFEKYAEQITNIGVVKEMSGSYINATKSYFEALEIFDSLKLELKSSMIYNNLGIVYQQLKENEKALEYYKKSLKITEKLKKSDISAKRYNNIASVYEDLEYKLDSSLFYYQKAHEIWIKDTNNSNLPIVENNLGYIYLLKNELKISDSLFNKALKFCIKNNQKNNISQILRNQAKLLMAQKKYNQTIKKANEAVNLAHNNSNKEIELESLSVLIGAFEKIKDFENANIKLKEYYKLQEEIRGIEQKNQINKLNIQYQVREKEQLIQILELENNVQNRKLWQQWFLIAALVFLLSGLFLVLRLQKKNNQLKLLQMQRDISDYIAQIEEITEHKSKKEQFLDETILNKIKEFNLTEREEEVLLYMSKGYKNSEIAEKMFVSINTIKTHTKNIFIKLDVRNRTEAARKAEIL
ncbi:MAG: tetratricopeptide repeat protein [Bacteroidales bacterium]|nr:tetratricopeptide repeat protein [Bacteroidales bacterium]